MFIYLLRNVKVFDYIGVYKVVSDIAISIFNTVGFDQLFNLGGNGLALSLLF